MSSSLRTAAATKAAKELIEMGIDRRSIGLKYLLLILGWAAINGQITEPESRLLLGRAGKLKHYASQGYLIQHDLPPGLKAAPHFPHLHYFHLSDKGMMLLLQHHPHLCEFGNMDLRQRLYLHDFIGRIEAMWRFRSCRIAGYIPECRLPELSSANHKQHDGHFIMHNGDRIGLEVEAADWKSESKLARFVAQCLNSIANNRVQRVLILTQTESAKRHYAEPFQAGKFYYPFWIKENGRWYPKQSSKTIISHELSSKVSIELIQSESEIADLIEPHPPTWLPSTEEYFEEGYFEEEDIE